MKRITDVRGVAQRGVFYMKFSNYFAVNNLAVFY
jgi:hypothetical protein